VQIKQKEEMKMKKILTPVRCEACDTLFVAGELYENAAGTVLCFDCAMRYGERSLPEIFALWEKEEK